jgi:hypothetical protein
MVLVITPEALVAVSLPRDMAAAMDTAREGLTKALEKEEISGRDFWEASAALSPGLPHAYFAPRQVPPELREEVASIRSRAGLDTAPWLRYAAMTPGQILAESPDSRSIPLDDILYARGEDLLEGPDGEDLLVVRTAEHEDRFRLSAGSYYPARVTLFSSIGRRLPIDQPGEKVVSIIPACFEPGPEGFEFQYSFNLVFSDRRLIMAISPGSEDEVERRWDAYLKSVEQKAKQKGQPLEAYVASGELPDAPWQDFRHRSIPEILDADGVNYFIPYSRLTGVAYRAGKKPTLSLSLASHTIILEANPLFDPGPLRTARDALQGILPITL